MLRRVGLRSRRPERSGLGGDGCPAFVAESRARGRSVLHEEQVKPRLAPQPRQKLDPGGFPCWHRGQIIALEARLDEPDTCGESSSTLAQLLTAHRQRECKRRALSHLAL